MSFFPLDRDILNSTIWIGTDSDTKTLWIYLLLSANVRTGIVTHTRPAIAHNSGVHRKRVDELLEQFASPDPDSRTEDNDGRRIEFVDGGLRILNYEKYKNKDHSTKRVKAYDERNPGRKHGKREEPGQRSATVGNGRQRSATTDKETDKETEFYTPPLPPSLEDACEESSYITVIRIWDEKTGGVESMSAARHRPAAMEIAKKCRALDPTNPEAVCSRVIDTWLSDPYVQKNPQNLYHLSLNFGKYSGNGVAKRGKTHEELGNEELEQAVKAHNAGNDEEAKQHASMADFYFDGTGRDAIRELRGQGIQL